jgi:hypothetical protein
VSIDYSAPYLLTADRWSLSTTFFFLGILNVRYKREDVKIQAWENHEKRKADTEMKKVQASLISDALDYFAILLKERCHFSSHLGCISTEILFTTINSRWLEFISTELLELALIGITVIGT